MAKAAHNIRLELQRLQVLEFGGGGSGGSGGGGIEGLEEGFGGGGGDRHGSSSSNSSSAAASDTYTATPSERLRSAVREYPLVVTGHSLGAGTAVLLTMMLKAAHPEVVCMSYGTPNSVVDARTADGKIDVRCYAC